MGNLNIAVVGAKDYAAKIGKKGTVTDMTFFPTCPAKSLLPATTTLRLPIGTHLRGPVQRGS